MRLKNMLYPVIIAPAWISEMNAVQHTETGEPKRPQDACEVSGDSME